jgi:hypothetical protein
VIGATRASLGRLVASAVLVSAAIILGGASGAPASIAPLGSTPSAQPLLLTVTVFGQGTVSSEPGGIVCPSACAASFAPGTQLRLISTAAPGWVFNGFGGGCSGIACVMTPKEPVEITATFVVDVISSAVLANRIRLEGPPAASRQLQVRVDAVDELSRIVLRIRRGGVVLQSKTVRGGAVYAYALLMNISNSVAAGRAQLEVIFVNEAGNQKVETRRIRIPEI